MGETESGNSRKRFLANNVCAVEWLVEDLQFVFGATCGKRPPLQTDAGRMTWLERAGYCSGFSILNSEWRTSPPTLAIHPPAASDARAAIRVRTVSGRADFGA